MRSEDRKRLTQRSYGNDERPSRVQGARTRDNGAFGECTGVACERWQTDEVGRSGGNSGSSTMDSDDTGNSGANRNGGDRTRARPPDGELPPQPDDAVRDIEDESGSSDDDLDWLRNVDIVPENERSQR